MVKINWKGEVRHVYLSSYCPLILLIVLVLIIFGVIFAVIFATISSSQKTTQTVSANVLKLAYINII